jgi:hypothetical protein
MKRFPGFAAIHSTVNHVSGFRVRLSKFGRRLGGLILAAVCTVTVFGIAMNHAPIRSVLAQTADLQAIAQQYPKFTKERQMALLRAQQQMAHPGLRGVSILKLIDRFLKTSFKPRSTTAAPPLAPFSGNLTAINAPGSDSLYLMRQSNCSLTLTNVYYGAPSGGDLNLTFDGSTSNYGNILHTAAGLSTTVGAFPNGCSSPILGISTRGGVYLGTTAQNLPLFAGARYDPMQGVNALYYATYNPSTGTIAYTVDTSDPNINAVTAGDLNGDGLADVVAIDQLTTSASVSVRLAMPNGTIAPGVSYPVTGKTAEAATIDDVNGDGKADVIVASIDSSGQEYVSVLTGNGDGTLNPAVAVAVPSPSYPTSTGENGSGAPVIESLGYYRIVNLITADLRGTGHKDIVASNGEVLLNNGSGAFTPSATVAFPAGNASSSNGPNLAAGDLNGDHKQDIVLCDGSGVSIYLGNGDGTFTPGQSYASIGDVGYVTITDLDGDGNADVYVGLGNGPFLGGDQFNMQQSYALMGNGDGTLRGAADLPFVYTGSNLVDLNNDGKLDAVAVTASALTDIVSFTSYLGKGDGTFTAKATLPISPVTVNGAPCYFGSLDSFALGDINGDGFADIVYIPTQNSCNSGFYVATGKGDGSFNTPVAVPNPIQYGTISGIQIADINHDGKADLVYMYNASNDTGSETTSTTDIGIAVQLSNGDGTFQAAQLVQTSSTLTYSNDRSPETLIATIGDVNGDGFPDIFFTQGVCGDALCSPVASYQLELLLGKGDGTFQTPYVMPADPAATGGYQAPFSQVVLADMNGDGHPDVVALSPASLGGLGIYLGNGDGTFSAPGNVNYAGAGLAIADFNGDGKLDVAISQAFGGSGIFLGNGDGTVQSSTDSNGNPQPSQTLIFGDSFSLAVAADFNGDGKPDLLFGSTLLLNQVSSATAPTLLATTTSLAASATTATSGQTITFTATVAPATGSGTPTGTVTFYDGTSNIGSGNLTAKVATFSTSALTVATHSITATYSGDTTYNTSTSAAVTVAVTAPPVATTTTLTASATSAVAGTSLTFTAVVAPASGSVAPTGTVTFYDGTTMLGTGTLTSGTATYSTAALAVGAHSITASYGGDSGNAASTSAALAVTITAPVAADFGIALAPASGSVAPGSSVTSTISITPIGGFSQQVSLSCAGAPQNATCIIAPSSVTPSGTVATATLTINTNVNAAMLDAPAGLHPAHRSHAKIALAFAGFAGLLCFGFTRKRLPGWRHLELALAAIILAGAVATGCGGSGSSNTTPSTTPAGTSTLTITATAGSITHAATYALTVQ